MRCIIILLLASSVAVHAGTDDQVHVSPDGRFAIYNLGDTAQQDQYFEIRAKDGTVLSSTKDDTGERWLPSFATDIMWSSNHQFVLFCYEHGKYKCTGIYSFPARKFLSLDHILDGYTLPIRWRGPRTFIVENSSPRGGHAYRSPDHYRQTFRVRTQPFRLDCIYTAPTITGEEAPDPR